MASFVGVTVRIGCEELGHRTGLWCDHCLLPSRVEGDFALMVNGRPDHVFTYTCCLDCGREAFL